MNWSSVTVPSTFDPARRPIFVTPAATMTAKNKSESYPEMVRAVRGMLRHHPDDRVLIHTVSYDLAKHLTRELVSSLGPTHKRVVTYTNSRERQPAIDKYLKIDGSVLIAPSLERGVDFRDDACRVVAVCKVPYPNLGDKQVSARMHSKGGNLWYGVQTARSLVQMTGRGMRAEDDFATAYILDAQFVSNVWKRNKFLLPKWWTEALEWSGCYVRKFKTLGE